MPTSSLGGWHYGTGFAGGVDFCLWVLEQDGLRVPPFDRHPDGDGRLREAGLDADAWFAWLHQVVAVIDEPIAALQQRPPDLERLRASRPERLWEGPAAVARRLEEMAEQHARFFNRRKRARNGGCSAPSAGTGPAG